MLLIVTGAIVGACQAVPTADVETTAAAESNIRTQCRSDYDCNGGVEGSGVVCSNSGDTAGTCIVGCHSRCDCGDSQTCVHTAPHWRCESIY
jgi:hypothetical protein